MSSLLLPSPRGTRWTRGGERTRSRFCTARQRFPPLGERSPPTPLGPAEPGLSGGTAASCGGLGTAEELHRNFAIVGAGRCPHPEFPRTARLGDAVGSPRTRSFLFHPAIALASRRPQRGHRAPPVPREMFQAFPGDYDSGSRCSSSPSAESQYLSSVDSFGSPPTAAASQVSSRGLGCCFMGFIF